MTKPLETAGKIAKPIIAKAAQLNPNINLSDPLMKEAKENPYTPEHLNAIHEATDGNMSLVQPSYKTEAVKKVGDEFIKPELDAKEETYRE